MDNVACSGNEPTLTSCSHNISHNCNHSADAGVQCQVCKSFIDLIINLLFWK